VDNRRYLELDRKRVGMIDDQFPTPRPFIFKDNGKPFVQFDSKNWEEWQRDWKKNWEEQQEKIREMLEKSKIDEIQNKLNIEMPKIFIQIKDLEDKIRLGYGFNNIGMVEDQLRLQVALVEGQLATMRAKYSETNPKTLKTRDLRDALEDKLHSVRSLRDAATRNNVIRGKRVTVSPAPAPAPKVAVTTSSF
jgi:hypothetical protein